MLSQISDTPLITAFVPVDSAFSDKREISAVVLRQHIWQGVPGYTPDLIVGRPQATMDGPRVTVTYRKDAYYVNNARIVRPNVITKNGVIHYIDQVWGFGLFVWLLLGLTFWNQFIEINEADQAGLSGGSSRSSNGGGSTNPTTALIATTLLVPVFFGLLRRRWQEQR